MAAIITLLLLGIGSGALVALSAMGLVLMYRSSGVVNFATGAIGMASSFVFWDLTRNNGWSAWGAGTVAVLVGTALGAVSYLLVMVLPRRSSNLTRVIGTLAILIILESVAQLRYGSDAETVKPFLPSGSLNFGGGIELPTSQLVLTVVSVVLALVLSAVYTRTTFGLATTAVSERPRTLSAFGWRVGTVGSVNWAIGGALAGLAGVLLSPITSVVVTNGHVFVVAVLAAALIGGMRSFMLTLAGGVLIGMLQSLFSIHDLGIPGLSDAVPFFVIIVVIMLRVANCHCEISSVSACRASALVRSGRLAARRRRNGDDTHRFVLNANGITGSQRRCSPRFRCSRSLRSWVTRARCRSRRSRSRA